MSLFGTSPRADGETTTAGWTPTRARSGGGGLFDDDDNDSSNGHGSTPRVKASNMKNGAGLFDDASSSPWDMPTPRKKPSRAAVLQSLLPVSAVPESYVVAFDEAVRGGRSVANDGVAQVFAAARLGPEAQKRIVSLVSADDDGGDGGDSLRLGRNEFNVLLALVGLAQEGEVISLDGVDERRRNLPEPKLAGLTADPVLPPVDELWSKPPGTPVKQAPPSRSQLESQSTITRPAMDDPEDDPWTSSTPGTFKVTPNGGGPRVNGGANGPVDGPITSIGGRNLSQYATETAAAPHVRQQSSGEAQGGGWGYFDGSGNSNSNSNAANAGASFNGPSQTPTNPFGAGDGSGQDPDNNPPLGPSRSTNGRTGGVEENVTVTLMAEKEGVFLFQHHNYEVASQRRGSKVIRRYSDFVWLLDCLQKRYPYRILPLLPPKRVAVNGNHLSNDTSFIEKRRRGLARFLNALVRHPVLSQEQLAIMFLTVPTELAVWRKQATISIEDEFTGRALPPGLEDSLPSSLEELFQKTRAGVRRSAELYTNVCNIMNRLIKRSEGVAADHGRVAASLSSLTETSADTYATDTNEVALLNDGLAAMSKHLKTCQSLLEDESRGWDEGVLEDLKRQRDALVSVQEMFERREKLDKDNIPYLERRIQTNESKLAGLRSKPEGTVKPNEIEKVAESIIKDKESIVQQHNRSIFVKETIRDELVYFQSTQYQVSRWNQDWAGERVKYSEMLADNWRRLIDGLEGMPLGD